MFFYSKLIWFVKIFIFYINGIGTMCIQKQEIFRFSKVHFAHFWCENSNIWSNIIVLQNYSNSHIFWWFGRSTSIKHRAMTEMHMVIHHKGLLQPTSFLHFFSGNNSYLWLMYRKFIQQKPSLHMVIHHKVQQVCCYCISHLSRLPFPNFLAIVFLTFAFDWCLETANIHLP